MSATLRLHNTTSTIGASCALLNLLDQIDFLTFLIAGQAVALAVVPYSISLQSHDHTNGAVSSTVHTEITNLLFLLGR